METFKNALKEMETAHGIISELCEFAVLLGIEEKYVNPTNAAAICFKALRKYVALEKEAEEAGTTLPNVMKSYRMRKSQPQPQSPLIPEEMTFAPPHWQQSTTFDRDYVWKAGRQLEKLTKRKEIDALSAQRLRARLEPMLTKLFSIVENQDWDQDTKDSYVASVVHSYKTEGFTEFSSSLSEALWSFTEGPTDNEVPATVCTFTAPAHNTPQFQECVETATVYSETIRNELTEWATESDLQIDPETLNYWAYAAPDRLFIHTMGESIPNYRSLRDKVELTLESCGLICSQTRAWSEEVHLDTVRKMAAECSHLLDTSGDDLTYDDIIDRLSSVCNVDLESRGCLSGN